MRISELSSSTGVPVPTIKYYVREGLLPRGTRRSSANQADYSEEHVRRLRLIRAVREVGGLPIAAVGAVVRAIDDRALSLHDVLGVVNRVESTGGGAELTPSGAGADQTKTHDAARARADVDRFLEELDWQVSDDAPARARLADALLALRRQGGEVDVSIFHPYAAAADTVAAAEVASVPSNAPRDEAVAYAVVGTIVAGSALLALRRLAQEHHSARLLRVPADGNGDRGG
jgi:DNA-binding transcriptional MerR regulator